jgi:serine/threonine-protein kinase
VQLCSQCGSVHRDGDRFCASCGATVGTAAGPKDPLVGRTLAGSYLILDLVGVGGMGRVYRAEQRMLGRTVAIKVVHPHLLSDEQSVARFYNEARAASRLNHPNSVSIIDFGRTDDGILYLVMEFLQGRDLARVMREDGPLPLARICELLIAVLAALGEAHALGVVHRDLKPENIIIERLRTGSDLIKVVDFGLAKLLGTAAGGESSVTSPGLVCGTPDYMSPEQGRGLPLDGRGDLYAVGVILFELLAEHLPYIADTPTNVVLRHIQDPIPDVREAAPERNIPQRLGEVTSFALAKLPEDRFQTANEMANALRRALGELQPGTREIACRACGMRSPSTKRFCGECGAPLMPFATPSAAMPRMSLPPRMTISRSDSAALIGRELELKRFEDLSEEANGVLVSVCLLGEAGVGKTRLLAELAERATSDGTLVVGAGPHDSGALVPYHPIRTMLLSLLGADDVELFRLAEELVDSEPLIAAGMRELLEPSGLRGADGRSRAGAVASALAYALREGMRATERERVLILVDDLHRCDGLTAQTLAELPEHSDGDSVMLVTASQHGIESTLGAETVTVTLRGLSLFEAHSLLGVPPPVNGLEDPDKPQRTFVPLYLAQLRALGHGLDGAPARLADAVLQRTQRLDVAAVRALQAACVLGNRCSRELLFELIGSSDPAPLEALERAGLLVMQDGQLDVVHPFVRDLVEGSIPAEARKALHARALGVASDAPLEVRALHAYGAGETLSALMLLERVGDLAYERGDPHSAVQAYRRGLDLVRRELLESGDTSLEEALASFSRRLGNALARNEDLTGAEGVLREALEFCPPHSIGRAHILLGLGRVVARRQRLRDAYRLLGEAVEIAIQRDDEAMQAAAHLAIGDLRVAETNAAGAVASFSAALQCLSSARADALTLAKAAVSLAASLALGGDARAAAEALQRAQDLAQRADAPHLQTRVLIVLGELHGVAQDIGAQQDAFRKARIAAARAGDATNVAVLDQLLHDLLPPEERPTLGMK